MSISHPRVTLMAWLAVVFLAQCSSAQDFVALSLSDSASSESEVATAEFFGTDVDPSAIALVGGCDTACCSTGTCDALVSGCDSCGSSSCCGCLPWWAHRTGAFGEILFLSPGNSDLIFAVEQNDPTANAFPTGPIGLSNIEEELGYRFGLSWALNNCTSIVGAYSRWDGDTTSFINRTGTNVINSLIIHPSTATTGAQSLSANAYQLVNFQTADVMMRRVYRANNSSVINWNAGVRYGNLEQGLVTNQTVAVGTGLTTVTTDIDFNGFGFLTGLDAERRFQSTGLSIYGKAFGSLLAGNWQADYTLVNQFGGGVIGNRYDDYRVSPVVDTELGLGWTSKGGGLRVTSGYMFSTWFNAVNNRDYIQAFRRGNLLDLDHSLTFSGLTFRTELRF